MTNEQDKKKHQTETQMTNDANTSKEVDPGIPAHIVDQYAGDSIDELRNLETANQHIAEDEISQQNENG